MGDNLDCKFNGVYSFYSSNICRDETYTETLYIMFRSKKSPDKCMPGIECTSHLQLLARMCETFHNGVIFKGNSCLVPNRCCINVHIDFVINWTEFTHP